MVGELVHIASLSKIINVQAFSFNLWLKVGLKLSQSIYWSFPLDVLTSDAWKECEDLLSNYYNITDGYVVQQKILDEQQARKVNRTIVNVKSKCSVNLRHVTCIRESVVWARKASSNSGVILFCSVINLEALRSILSVPVKLSFQYSGLKPEVASLLIM